MVHKYLFFIDNSCIQSYKLHEDRIDLMKYKGEESCSLADKSFWNWWEKNSSFIREEDVIDFCVISNIDIISNIDSYVFNLDYKTVEVSTWNKHKIKMFLDQYVDYSYIKLKNVKDKKDNCIEFANSPQIYQYQKTFEYNMFTLPSTSFDDSLKTNLKNIDGNNIKLDDNSLRGYYLEQLYKV